MLINQKFTHNWLNYVFYVENMCRVSIYFIFSIRSSLYLSFFLICFYPKNYLDFLRASNSTIIQCVAHCDVLIRFISFQGFANAYCTGRFTYLCGRIEIYKLIMTTIWHNNCITRGKWVMPILSVPWDAIMSSSLAIR